MRGKTIVALLIVALLVVPLLVVPQGLNGLNISIHGMVLILRYWYQ